MLWPDAIKVPMQYSITKSYTQAAGVITDTFTGNDISSQQPSGYTFWQGVYGRFYVNRSTIQVSMMNTTEDVGRMIIYTDLETNAATDLDKADEARHKVTQNFGQIAQINSRPLYMRMSTAKVYGVKPSGVNYSAAFGSNPSNKWYFHITAKATDGVFNEPNLRIKLTFFCRLYQPVFRAA